MQYYVYLCNVFWFVIGVLLGDVGLVVWFYVDCLLSLFVYCVVLWDVVVVCCCDGSLDIVIEVVEFSDLLYLVVCLLDLCVIVCNGVLVYWQMLLGLGGVLLLVLCLLLISLVYVGLRLVDKIEVWWVVLVFYFFVQDGVYESKNDKLGVGDVE